MTTAARGRGLPMLKNNAFLPVSTAQPSEPTLGTRTDSTSPLHLQQQLNMHPLDPKSMKLRMNTTILLYLWTREVQPRPRGMMTCMLPTLQCWCQLFVLLLPESLRSTPRQDLCAGSIRCTHGASITALNLCKILPATQHTRMRISCFYFHNTGRS